MPLEKAPPIKKKAGITLVSLVITIIVLLILAGVAINLAIDEEGLIGKAEEAVESWNSAVGKERSQNPPVRFLAIVRQERKEPDFARTDQDYDTVRE